MDVAELRRRQAWSLERKIDHAVGTLEAFDAYCREHGRHPYVSFSGGKDSTVLLDLARRFVDRDMPAVFCNTGNEWPEIVGFVRKMNRITVIRPAMTLKQVIGMYGFPLVSKEQAQAVRQIRTTRSEKLRNYRLYGNGKREAGVLSGKWSYLVKEPYMVSEKCCEVLKKRPFSRYQWETGGLPVIGTMAGESEQRKNRYLRRGGCNSFSERVEASRSFPLSVWTDADVWAYIRRFGVPYSAVYDIPGVIRTGCVVCAFGAHFPNDCRFRLLHKLYPKMYALAMDMTNNGVTLRVALRRMGVVLPDEDLRLF